MDGIERAQWRKSSFSGDNGGGCVEVASNLPGVVAVRDSKNRSGPALALTPSPPVEICDVEPLGERYHVRIDCLQAQERRPAPRRRNSTQQP